MNSVSPCTTASTTICSQSIMFPLLTCWPATSYLVQPGAHSETPSRIHAHSALVRRGSLESGLSESRQYRRGDAEIDQHTTGIDQRGYQWRRGRSRVPADTMENKRQTHAKQATKQHDGHHAGRHYHGNGFSPRNTPKGATANAHVKPKAPATISLRASSL